MELKKLDGYRGFNRLYSDRAYNLLKRIEEQVNDKFALEEIQELVELCYLEGYHDGFHFADWLNYKTY